MREGKRTRRMAGVARGVLVALTMLISASGCRMVGSQSPPTPAARTVTKAPDPAPEGSYRGLIEIEGGELESVLHLTREGTRRLKAVLDLASDLRAEGWGEVDASSVRLDLSYAGACPGRMVLVGRWDSARDELSGVVRASDCTGEAEGTFRFTSGNREGGNRGTGKAL